MRAVMMCDHTTCMGGARVGSIAPACTAGKSAACIMSPTHCGPFGARISAILTGVV